MACELGKLPAEIEASMSMDDLLEFAGYLALQRPERTDESTVEGKLLKNFGKPS